MAANSCFTRQHRLLQSREFQHVFNNTQCKSADQLLTLLAAFNDGDQARLGLALSKKRIRTAVARNHLKRLVRESFRHHQHTLPNIDIVVVGQTRAAQVSNQEILASLDVHWKNLTAKCKKSSSS
ncbi:MAG TPA: ribonuclease P protein component [Gammaproteobacteria bacterium]